MKSPLGLPIDSTRLAAALTFLVLGSAAACSDRAPTAPASTQERERASSSATAALPRRPPTRVLAPRGHDAPLPSGSWGGDRAQLDATSAGATVRLFCAHGAIVRPVFTDGEGRFSASGWLVREGGPTPIDDTPFRRPALYVGRVNGLTMTLDVLVDSTPPALGPFTLVLGQKSALGPCPIL